MGSEFWKRKMRTYIALWDFDRDGVISREEWDRMPVRFASFKEADPKKVEHLKTTFDSMYDQFLKEADSDNKSALTVPFFQESVWKQRNGRDLKKRISEVLFALFDVLDVNDDGYLDEDEHRRWFHQLGVGIPDTSFTKDTFNAIDVNHDGKLSFQEYVDGCYDFFFSEDEKSPFTLFFGPLVD